FSPFLARKSAWDVGADPQVFDLAAFHTVRRFFHLGDVVADLEDAGAGNAKGGAQIVHQRFEQLAPAPAQSLPDHQSQDGQAQRREAEDLAELDERREVRHGSLNVFGRAPPGASSRVRIGLDARTWRQL